MHGLKRILVVLFIFVIFLFLPREVFAQVMINEFSSGTSSDWIELYNQGTVLAQLTGLRLRDSSSSNKKDLSGELGIGAFQIVTFSNWLNNDGDKVRLIKVVDENEEVLEEIPYGSAGGLCVPGENGSIGRFPNGSSSLVRFLTSTNGTSNDMAQEDPCQTPTPTREPTLTPTPTIPSSTDTPVPPTPTLPTSYSSIYINEFLPDPETGNNEKVEIKNNNNFTVSLVNWKIDDIENGGHSSKTFSTDISPSGLFTIDLGSDSFLNNNGDSVRLLDFNDAQKDKRDYSQSTKNLSWSKDRSGNWCQQTSSFNAENSDCQPVATSVPTSTSQPTVTLTPTVRVSSTPTPSPTIKPTDGEILGAEDASESFELALNNATDSSLPNDGDATVAGVAKSNKLPPSWPFIGIGSAFLAAMVGSAVIVVRKKLSLS